ADGVSRAAVVIGHQPSAVPAEAAIGMVVGRRLPDTLARCGFVDADAGIVMAEGDPAAVRADTGPFYTRTSLDAARLRGIGMKDPTAGIVLHAVTGEHGLGDHLTAAARSDRLVAGMEGQSLGWANDESSGPDRIGAYRPAKESREAVRQQIAGAVEPNGLAAPSALHELELAPGLQVDQCHTIIETPCREAAAWMDGWPEVMRFALTRAVVDEGPVLAAIGDGPQTQLFLPRPDASRSQSGSGGIKAQCLPRG